MTAERHPRACLECGQPVIHSARAKTCSERCRKEHQRKVKRALYEKHRGTEEFKASYAVRVERAKQLRAADPALKEAFDRAHKQAVSKSVDKRNADPVRREKQLQQMRDWKSGAGPEQKETLRTANRAWYSALSPEAKAALIKKKTEQRRVRKAQARAIGTSES